MNIFSKHHKNSLLALYRNGNYYVRFYETILNFIWVKGYSAFPESVDFKSYSYFDGACPMCYEDFRRTDYYEVTL